MRVADRKAVRRSRDLDPLDIWRVYLQRLCEHGLLRRVGRGLYLSAHAELTERHTLAEACRRLPHGIVCLLSALRFHELTKQAPFETWMAIEGKAWRPRVDWPVMRFVRFSGKALTEGVEEHRIEGVTVKVYGAAKTVADCFKYRKQDRSWCGAGSAPGLPPTPEVYERRPVAVCENLPRGKCDEAHTLRP